MADYLMDLDKHTKGGRGRKKNPRECSLTYCDAIYGLSDGQHGPNWSPSQLRVRFWDVPHSVNG